MWSRYVCVCLLLGCVSAMSPPRGPTLSEEDEIISWLKNVIVKAQCGAAADKQNPSNNEDEIFVSWLKNIIVKAHCAAVYEQHLSGLEQKTVKAEEATVTEQHLSGLEQKTEKAEEATVTEQRLTWFEEQVLKASVTGQCGWNNPDLFVFKEAETKRVYADYGEFPWMVAIMKRSGTTVWSPNDYIGGGIIIHPSVVVTLSYKVHKLSVNEIKCRGGEWDTSSNKEQYPIQERNVVDKTLHPGYYRNFAAALLFLEIPFDLNNAPHMGPACLIDVYPRPGAECFALGWRKDLVNDIRYDFVLKKTKVSLEKVYKMCERTFNNLILGPFSDSDSRICADEEGLNSRGDEGSLLVCSIETIGSRVRYAVVGLVAYGMDGVEADLPDVYLKSLELYAWINEEMTNRNYGNATYTP